MCAIDFDSYTKAGFPALNKTSMIVQRQLIEMQLSSAGDSFSKKHTNSDNLENDDFMKCDNYFENDVFNTINNDIWIAS